MREQKLHTEGRENCSDVWLLSHCVASLGEFRRWILCMRVWDLVAAQALSISRVCCLEHVSVSVFVAAQRKSVGQRPSAPWKR
jgi:hypothetical protein